MTVMDAASPAERIDRIFEVVGIAGSLRRESYNRALLRAAAELAAPGIRVTTYDLTSVPLYNADVDAGGAPQSVVELREAVRQSDGLLIATPEYNYGVPGLLKNAVDWLSRPRLGSCLDGKPAAVMGASPGMTGTARSQAQLRQAFVSTNTPTLLQPEVLVSRANDKFNLEGQLTDQATRDVLKRFLAQFGVWIARFVMR
jgi:chromate reductase